MSESLFGRLFTYARAEGHRPIENFTTEALAAAIRSDPAPFTSTLARHGAIASLDVSTATAVTTQEFLAGVGILDLVYREFERSRIRREVWVEVKVWAGQTGNQLERYSQQIARLDDGVHRVLITLGPRPLDGAEGIPWIPWQSLRDAVAITSTERTLWNELIAFLEEQNVADQSTDPITAREVTSLREAHSLFLKATRVLTEVSTAASERWPEWGWGSRDQVTQQILGQFQRHARMTIFTTNRPVYLVLGFSDLHGTGEAQLTVWVESDPKKPAKRSEILQQADAGLLSSEWIRRLDTWQALANAHRAATVDGLEAQRLWFLTRLEELHEGGIIPMSEPMEGPPS